MPKRKYSRRTSKPARRVRRRLFKKRRGRNAVPRVLRSLVENKVHDTNGSDTDLGTNGHAMYLNANVAEGDGATNREGRKVTFTSCQYRAIVETTGTADPDPADRFIRFLVFIDKTPVQETMSLSDLISTTNPTIAFRTWNESFRYKMIKDFTVHLPTHRSLVPSTDIESNVIGSRTVDFSIPLKMHTEWISATGGTDQISKNSLVVLAVSNKATSDVKLTWNSRMKFVDL